MNPGLANFEIRNPGAPDGYRCVGHFFQAFAPSGWAFPEELVRAIRNDLDPEICPMWANHVYRNTTGGIYKTGRFWLWREVRDLQQFVKTPKFLPDTYGLNAGRLPNTPLMALEMDRTEHEQENNLAGGFLPFDDWVYDLLKQARDAYEPDYDKEADRREAAAAEEKARLEKVQAAETAYRVDHEFGHMKKQFENLTAEEKRLVRDYGLFGVPLESPRKVSVDLHTGA